MTTITNFSPLEFYLSRDPIIIQGQEWGKFIAVRKAFNQAGECHSLHVIEGVFNQEASHCSVAQFYPDDDQSQKFSCGPLELPLVRHGQLDTIAHPEIERFIAEHSTCYPYSGSRAELETLLSETIRWQQGADHIHFSECGLTEVQGPAHGQGKEYNKLDF